MKDSESKLNTEKNSFLARKTEFDMQSKIIREEWVSSDAIEFNKDELKDLDDLHIRYQILKRFAEGGQADIKSALDKVLKRKIAVKSLKSKYQENEKMLSDFIKEAKLTAQLDHPSIIPLYDLRKDDEGKIHLVMKLISGKSLSEIIEDNESKRIEDENSKKYYSLTVRIEDFIKVCDAVHYAHCKGVIHRDLKPENIMLGPFHEVYVMDWGIAQTLNENHLCDNLEESVPGTPEYIAPEIVRDEPYGPASDQYSLGVVLYELATLKRLKSGNTIQEIIRKNCNGKFVSDEYFQSPVNLPQDLIAIIRKATDLNPEKRYKSVAEFADDLRRFIRGEETLARPDNFIRRFMRILVLHKNLFSIILLCSLLIASFAIIFSLVHRQHSILEAKRRSILLSRIQGAVSEEAHKINSIFLKISDDLNALADSISLLTSDYERESKSEKLFESRHFDAENALSEAVYSEVYRQKVNFRKASYIIRDPEQKTEAEKITKRLSYLVPKLLKIMTASAPQYLYLTEDRIIELAISKGLPILWIYAGFENSLFINYPGIANISQDYDFQKREWYISASRENNVVWTPPYIDKFGTGIIMTVSRSIKNDKNDLIGVAGLDIGFDFLIDIMRSENTRKHIVKCSYLIDPDGNIILSSNLNRELIKEAEATYSKIKFGKFHYHELCESLKKHRSGQLEIERYNSKILLSYAWIPVINLFYLEELDLEKLLIENQ